MSLIRFGVFTLKAQKSGKGAVIHTALLLSSCDMIDVCMVSVEIFELVII